MIRRLLPDAAAVGPDLAPTPTDSDRNFPAHPAPRTMLGLLFALMLVLLLAPEPSAAEQPGHTDAPSADVAGVDALVLRLTKGSFSLVDGSSKVVGRRRQGDAAPELLAEQSVVETLQSAALSDEQANRLWEFFGNDTNASMATLRIVKALISASRSPKAREPLWSTLVGLAREHDVGSPERARSLLGLFERHRTELLPLFGEARETEGSGDEMVELLLETQIFGADFDKGADWLSAYDPAPLARKMERERALGKPVPWEAAVFWSMVRWKDARLVAKAGKAPRTLAALDHVGESFIIIFNCLHDMNPKYREAMVYGLGPFEVFNLVVGGEAELYRLGTSTYRAHLHAVIMRGIKESGSLEAFLDKAMPRWLGEEAVVAAPRRAMIFLRLVSSFGLLEQVLSHVRDRERFIAGGIASLGDARSFEGNSAVAMDVLTSRSSSPAVVAFKRTLLDQLYARHQSETDTTIKSVYGSILSVYQTVTGDRRDPAIDQALPLDDAIFRVPFDRLFTADGAGGYVHRMVMRLDQDVDAVTTHANFRTLMRARGASMHEDRHYVVYRIAAQGRLIEIYANKPTALGVSNGIADITTALRGLRVETVIGRGHTSIVKSMKESAKRVLGDRTKDVAVVLVGSCGGDASVRDLIGTFGYRSFFATRSTGRLLLNNAIIESYITALMALAQDARLSLEDVLVRATAPYMRQGVNEDLRDDASFYRLSLTTVLTARLFDTHVRRIAEPDRQVAQR